MQLNEQENVCLLCNEPRLPSGQTLEGRFKCSTCNREWILEKRKNRRYTSFFDNPENKELLTEFITIFDSNLREEEIYIKLAAILKSRMLIHKISIALLDTLTSSIRVSFYTTEDDNAEKNIKKLQCDSRKTGHPFNICIDEKKVVINDISSSSDFDKYFKIYKHILGNVNYQLLFPIYYRAIPLGILILDFADKEEMEKIYEHSKLIQLLMEQFSIALYNSLSHSRSTKKYISYINLNSASLLLNKLYMNNSSEIIRMTLLSISGFINTDLNILMINHRKNKTLTMHRLFRGIDNLDLSTEQITTESYSRYTRLFNTREPTVLKSKREKVTGLLGFKGEEVLVLPSFIVEGNEYAFILGRNSKRLFSDDEIELLNAYASQVKITLENSFLTQKIAHQERLEKEVEIAKDIQLNLLPKTMPEHPRYEFGGFMRPAREIGGDYYDIIVAPDKSNYIIAIGDVSGKGIPAGMVMATARTIIHSIVRKDVSPWDIIKGVNTFMYYNYKNSMSMRFMSLILFRWDCDTNRFSYAGAGHGDVFVYRKESHHIEIVPTGGVILGIQQDIAEFQNESYIDLDEGDCILMFTDGATEAMNSRAEPYEEDRLLKSFEKYVNVPCKEMLNSIFKDIQSFMGETNQHDDVTMLTIKRKV